MNSSYSSKSSISFPYVFILLLWLGSILLSPEDEVQVEEDKEEDGADGDKQKEEDPEDPGLKRGRGLREKRKKISTSSMDLRGNSR